MNKKLKITLITIILIVVIISLFFSIRTLIQEPGCFASGGVERTFSNGCVDSCAKARQTPDNPIICTMTFTSGCDCGSLRCWNYDRQRCVLN